MNRLYTISTCMLTFFSASSFSANFEGPAWPQNTVPYVYSTSAPLTPEAKTAFEEAVDYYSDNTLVKLVEVQPGAHSYPKVLTVSGITSGNANATIGFPNSCTTFIITVCEQARLRLRENSSTQTAIHEIFHVLGFKHEHQRADRDEHVDIDEQAIRDAGEYASNNYGVTSWNYILGSYDMRSISHYRNGYFSIAESAADTFDLFDMLASPADYERGFRLNAPDSTPETIFDNPAVHIENHPGAAVEDVPPGWHSALWDFEYVGAGEYFKIRSFWQDNQYLVDGGSAPILESEPSNTVSAFWQVSVVDGKFQLKNVGAGSYLSSASGPLSYTSDPNGGLWIPQAVMPYGPDNYLSPMDMVALHKAYGEVFRIQLVDDTADSTDNKTLHVQNLNADDSVDVEPLPFDPENYWHSAMWHLVQKGKYFMVKNLWTGEYLHTENGAIATDPDGTTNGGGADITHWHSAHWELELLDDAFRIKNQWTGKYLFNDQGKLGVTELPSDLDSNWEINFVDWSNE